MAKREEKTRWGQLQLGIALSELEAQSSQETGSTNWGFNLRTTGGRMSEGRMRKCATKFEGPGLAMERRTEEALVS